jgi:hypothetical protein
MKSITLCHTFEQAVTEATRVRLLRETRGAGTTMKLCGKSPKILVSSEEVSSQGPGDLVSIMWL